MQVCGTYGEFWPEYLREHARPATRAIHYFGTILSAAVLVWAVATQNWWWLLAVPFLGYGPAWFAHFFVELLPPPTIANSDRNGALGIGLPDDVPVQMFHDLARG